MSDGQQEPWTLRNHLEIWGLPLIVFGGIGYLINEIIENYKIAIGTTVLLGVAFAIWGALSNPEDEEH